MSVVTTYILMVLVHSVKESTIFRWQYVSLRLPLQYWLIDLIARHLRDNVKDSILNRVVKIRQFHWKSRGLVGNRGISNAGWRPVCGATNGRKIVGLLLLTHQSNTRGIGRADAWLEPRVLAGHQTQIGTSTTSLHVERNTLIMGESGRSSYLWFTIAILNW